MRKPRPARLLALALCLVLALSTLAACSKPPLDFDFDLPFDLPIFGERQPAQPGGEDEAEHRERRTIPYAEMEYSRPDVAAMQTEARQLTEQLKTAADIDTVLALEEELGAIAEEFDTMHTLAMLKSYHDATDSFYEEELRALDEADVEMSTLYNDFYRVIIDGPLATAYRDEVGNHLFKAVESSLLLDSEAVQDYKKERAALANDYSQKLSTLTADYEGQTYTLDDLYTVDSLALFEQLYLLLFDANAEDFTRMYARMVELDKLTAYELGFDNAIDMYYLSYGRDYTKEDAKALFENVKQYIVPLIPLLYSVDTTAGEMDQTAVMAALPDALAQVDSELREAWDFMQQYGVTDLDTAPNKKPGGFTTSIAAYDTPFIFMNWEEGYYSFYSLTTLIHEFGHFYNAWLNYDTDAVQGLDVAEVHSQGLEVLTQQQYAQLGVPYPESAQFYNLQSLALGAIVQQCAYEDFQMRVYELDTFDADIIGKVYNQVNYEYGLGMFSYAYEGEADHSWFPVTHFFEVPFYTVSYATSATVALQIWAESQQDWDAAANTYMKLLKEDQNQDFTDLLTGAGLRSPLEASVMEEISSALSDAFFASYQADNAA